MYLLERTATNPEHEYIVLLFKRMGGYRIRKKNSKIK
jgi:hypothetical protein